MSDFRSAVRFGHCFDNTIWFIVMLVSVWFPMRLASIKTPMSLIISQDNSNLVTSPRRSLNIFGTKFPLQYELFTTWRFRKYTFDCLFPQLYLHHFSSAAYVAEITRTTLSMDKPQFKVTFRQPAFPLTQ